MSSSTRCALREEIAADRWNPLGRSTSTRVPIFQKNKLPGDNKAGAKTFLLSYQFVSFPQYHKSLTRFAEKSDPVRREA